MPTSADLASSTAVRRFALISGLISGGSSCTTVRDWLGSFRKVGTIGKPSARQLMLVPENVKGAWKQGTVSAWSDLPELIIWQCYCNNTYS